MYVYSLTSFNTYFLSTSVLRKVLAPEETREV